MTDKKKIRILVADDHTIVRRGIVSLLSLNPAFEVVGEAANGRIAVDLTLQKLPDVILMDISMPEVTGLDATKQIKKRLPDAKILVLSAYDNEEYVTQVLQSGANGYLLKNASPEDIYAAVKAVNDGLAFFSPGISKIVLDSYVKKSLPASVPRSEAGHALAVGPLTVRETEILQLVAEGKSHQQIADLLFISVRTVDTHRNNIMKKLNLHDTASLVTYALKHGIAVLPK
ncbi:MAG TPA: response regulator transcription factor [Bacteroidota bacterium]|nr:response regulator transcription factor [Bacteroidota bacterium]